jgi:hypothetical protein
MPNEITKDDLLAEVDDLLRSMPTRETIRDGTPQSLEWLGRSSAVIEKWDYTKSARFVLAIDQVYKMNAYEFRDGYRKSDHDSASGTT